MSEYVTFLGVDSDANPITYIVATVYSPSGALIAQETFDTRTPGVAPTHILLAPGSYLVTARGDGMKFPLHYPVVIREGDGPTAPTAFEVTIPGSTSEAPGTELPCRVFGYAPTASANSLPGSAVPSIGTTYDDGPSMGGVTVELNVWFRLQERADGEVRNLAGKERTRVAADRNGYFAVLLRPDSLYSVSLPNVAGVRYFRTPGAGVEAELETLINASQTHSLSELA